MGVMAQQGPDQTGTTTMTSTKANATAAYAAHRDAIIAKAKALIANLEAQDATTKNWADAGSLNYVREGMNDINRFMSL